MIDLLRQYMRLCVVSLRILTCAESLAGQETGWNSLNKGRERPRNKGLLHLNTATVFGLLANRISVRHAIQISNGQHQLV